MTEQTCLSDLLEKGMKKMEEQGLQQTQCAVFEWTPSTGELRSCCALGAMLLATAIEPDNRVETSDALKWIGDICPSIKTSTEYPSDEDASGFMSIGDVLWRLNDGTDLTTTNGARLSVKPHSLPEIAAWLKAQGL